jgi:Receptor family ligand binding region
VPADGDPLLLLLLIRALLLQVSFFSTSPELSNKQRFEFFTRTIPSDHYQVKAMVDIVGRMGWKYISILYEESNYGIKVMSQTLFFPASLSALVRSAPCWGKICCR